MDIQNTIHKYFDAAFGIRPEEFKIVNIFLMYLTVLYTAYTVISTAALALFLGRIDNVTLHTILPWLYIAIAIVVSVIAKIYQTLIDKFTRIKLISWTTAFFVFSFLILRLLIATGIAKTGVYALLMIWDETSCVILIMVFYSFLGDYFQVHHARRLYAYITGGMALGAPIGGFGSAFILKFISTPNLIYIGIILHVIAAFIAYKISKNAIASQMNVFPKKIKNPLFPKNLMFNKYMWLLFIAGAFPIICACIDSYQMAYIASKTLNENELGKFMGKFYGYAGLMLLLIDFLLAKWFRQRSIFTNLLFMPVLLAFSCIAFIIKPILIFAAAIKFVDNVLTNTVNTFAFQVLFLPLPERIRMHVQAMSAGIMTAGAKILGGCILVFLAFLYAPIQFYAIIIFLMTLLWIISIFLLIPLYKKELAASTSKINLKAINFETIVNDPMANDIIQKILDSNDKDSIVNFLQALQKKSFHKYKAAIEKLFTHPEPIIATEALNTYSIFGDFKMIEKFKPSINNNLSFKKIKKETYQESAETLLQDYVSDKLSDSNKSIILNKMAEHYPEIAAPHILNIINTGYSFVLMVGAYHALNPISESSLNTNKNEIKSARENIANKLIILRQAYQEMHALPELTRKLYTDTIYFYTGILFALLSVEFNTKELIHLKDLVLTNNEKNDLSLLELFETVVPSNLVKQYKIMLSPITQLSFIADFPSKATIQKLMSLDPWINNITLYGIGGADTMKNENPVYFNYIETMLFLKQVNLFTDIPINFLAPIAEAIYEQNYLPGEFIFKEGENSYSLFIIKSGSVKIQSDKKDIIILKVGDSFGELALLENLPHSASACSLENTTLFRLNSEDFLKIIDTYPEVSKSLLKILARRLRSIALDLINR